ncbi:AmmeMemoRadiSam system radical SAM enzyme [Sporofaciens sp. JLR.KK001]|uniref:AmmeMemoRadiSam system radical SAM enzyme n=1 Tax=Sporofaciens sp. JLR.KK001 TaxID=3112621 RepID=UPI002FF243A3
MKQVCRVCMHQCNLNHGQTGICKARKNEEGKIVCVSYGQITSMALDPIEKKPLRLFRPGSLILSVGSFGCNLRCPFCQNYEISMASVQQSEGNVILKGRADTVCVSCRELADKALEYRTSGNIGVAFTYNEPLVGWEYVRDTARLVRDAGMVNVMVTNGTASCEVLDELLPYIDAMNIDLKAFCRETYRELGGDLDTVKRFIVRAAEECHVELTTLIVPGMNDDVGEMEEEAGWIASVEDKAGKKIPLHVTRFYPRYHMTDRQATDVRQVYRLAETAGRYLEHVFVGNC